MSLDLLDALFSDSIAVIMLSVLAIGVAQSLKFRKAYWVRVVAGVIGGVAALSVFFLFHFTTGWNEYFAAKSTEIASPTNEYRGKHQGAANLIRMFGELGPAMLGLVFAAVAVALFAFAFKSYRALRQA
jgi:hypothetical protein